MSITQPLLLLVEDETSLINIYTTVFKPYFNVIVADTYESALSKLAQYKPTIIILDIIIPVASDKQLVYADKVGLNLLKQVNRIPTIVFTNLNDAQDRQLAMELGACDYILKSNILPKQLLKKIFDILQLKTE
ncbi:MAG: response regulator [Patescibacteria group bacterium]